MLNFKLLGVLLATLLTFNTFAQEADDDFSDEQDAVQTEQSVSETPKIVNNNLNANQQILSNDSNTQDVYGIDPEKAYEIINDDHVNIFRTEKSPEIRRVKMFARMIPEESFVRNNSLFLDENGNWIKRSNCYLGDCFRNTLILINKCKEFLGHDCPKEYDKVKIDFSRLGRLAPGEREVFALRAYNVKPGSSKIKFEMYNTYTKEQYLIESKKNSDNIIVYPESEKVVRAEKAKQKEIKDRLERGEDIVDSKKISELENQTVKWEIPVSKNNSQSNEGTSSSSSSSSVNKKTVKEVCFNKFNTVDSIKTVSSSSSKVSTSSSSHHSDEYESDSSTVSSSVSSKISDACSLRRDHLLQVESIAGVKQAISQSK